MDNPERVFQAEDAARAKDLRCVCVWYVQVSAAAAKWTESQGDEAREGEGMNFV